MTDPPRKRPKKVVRKRPPRKKRDLAWEHLSGAAREIIQATTFKNEYGIVDGDAERRAIREIKDAVRKYEKPRGLR